MGIPHYLTHLQTQTVFSPNYFSVEHSFALTDHVDLVAGRIEVGEKELFNIGPGGNLAGLGRAKMSGEIDNIREGTFTDQKVRPPGKLDQGLAVAGITGIDDRSPPLIRQAVGNALRIMENRPGPYLPAAAGPFIVDDLVNENPVPPPLQPLRVDSVEPFQEILQPRRSSNQDVPRSGLQFIPGSEKEMGQPQGMIGVEMSDQDPINLLMPVPGAQQPSQDIRTAVEEQPFPTGLYHQAGRSPPQRGDRHA